MPQVWDRKVARLPAQGLLLFATDLHGNLRDYEALKAIYYQEKRLGNQPILLFCGDLVHGPSPDLAEPDLWPDYLGSFYRDRSRELILDFERFSQKEHSFSLMGNHEHAHIGGPPVPKFHPDEAAYLDQQLGADLPHIQEFLQRWPLIALSDSGFVLTHAAPYICPSSPQELEGLSYAGYEQLSLDEMYHHDLLTALLWARMARPSEARAFLQGILGQPQGFVAFGHDIVREGWEIIGREQICLSTSFGLEDRNKVYLRLDLGQRYSSAFLLRYGEEIRPLYPKLVELGSSVDPQRWRTTCQMER